MRAIKRWWLQHIVSPEWCLKHDLPRPSVMIGPAGCRRKCEACDKERDERYEAKTQRALDAYRGESDEEYFSRCPDEPYRVTHDGRTVANPARTAALIRELVRWRDQRITTRATARGSRRAGV